MPSAEAEFEGLDWIVLAIQPHAGNAVGGGSVAGGYIGNEPPVAADPGCTEIGEL